MSTPTSGGDTPSPIVERRQTAPAKTSASSRRRRLTGSQWARVLLVLVLAIATLVARRQQPDPDPFDGTTLVDAFLRKREANAFRRGPVVRGSLLGVYARPGGEQIWAVGSPGLIAYSLDGGNTWNQGRIVAPPELRDTARSIDSLQVQEPEFLDYLGPLRSVWFTSDSVGWIAGDGMLLKSETGGRTWQKVVGGVMLNTVQFLNPNDGWALGDSAAYKTGNGRDWNRLETHERFTAVEFTSRGVGWAIDNSGQVLRTTDGAEWSVLSLPAVTPNLPAGFSRHANLDALSDVEAFVAITTRQLPADSAVPGPVITQHFYTRDGGANWAVRQEQRNVDLASIRFLTRSAGVGLTREGVVYRTTNGGTRWRVQQRLPIRGMTSMFFSDADHGFVVGAQTLWMTSDAGRTWRYVGGGQALNAAHFFNERRGVAVGQNGLAASTTDGGRTWVTQDVGTREDLNDVAFMPNGRGWAVGRRGALLYSSNRGRSWRLTDLKRAPTDDSLGSIHSESYNDISLREGGGWIVGTRGALLQVAGDGSLSRHIHIADESLRAVDFVNDSLGWALGVRGLWQTRDSGRSWALLPRTDSSHFSTIEFFNQNVGWAAAGDTIFRTTDGGLSWISIVPPSAARVLAIRFASPYDGWAAGRNGHIWTTRDGGQSWGVARVAGFDPQRGAPDLLGLANFSDTLAWAVGEGGTVVAGIRSSDWAVVSKPPTRGLPGWWVLMMAIGGILLAVTYHLRNAREVVSGIDDMFASDRPLQVNDRDQFDFGRLARGISRFLRNEGTTAPLTVAITGPWGTGKTSLMNLVRYDLRYHGVRTVWFNAWDHNEEEQLLASLLANVQVQAIPKIVRPWQWLWFRLRLFWIRVSGQSPSGNQRPAAYIALISLAVFLGWVTANTRDVDRVLRAFGQFLTSLGSEGGLAQFFAAVQTSASVNGVFGPSVLLVSGLSVLVAAWRTFRVFGLNPSKVATTLGKRFALRDTAGTVGYRHRFAEDFGEMVRALDSRLVIFVDDLDRCDHDCVYRVLEAINFLNAAGECIVVLGTDRQLFRASLRRHFLKELKEVGAQIENSPFTDPAHYSEEFLEKLINIEIPVPRIENGKLVGLIHHSVRSETMEIHARNSWGSEMASVRLAAAFWIVLLLTNGIVRSASAPLIANREETTIAASGAPEVGARIARPDTPLVSPPIQVSAASRTSAVFDVSTPVSGPGVLYIGLSLLIATFVAGYLRRPPRIVHDAPEFVTALNAWSVLVAEHAQTPRRLKRYLNSLRYYAMAAEDSGNDNKRRWQVAWEWARKWFFRTAHQPHDTPEPIRLEQPVLVALASIELCKPEWLKNETVRKQLLKRPGEFFQENLLGDRYQPIRDLGYKDSVEDQWDDFFRISQTLRTQ